MHPDTSRTRVLVRRDHESALFAAIGAANQLGSLAPLGVHAMLHASRPREEFDLNAPPQDDTDSWMKTVVRRTIERLHGCFFRRPREGTPAIDTETCETTPSAT